MSENGVHETIARPNRGPISPAREDSLARRRLLGFGRHLAGYFAAMFVLVIVNMTTAPENPWFIWPLVGYGGVLAIHAAYVMGLFNVFARHDTTPPSRNG